MNVSFLGLDWGTNNISFQTISVFFTAVLNPECFLPLPPTPKHTYWLLPHPRHGAWLQRLWRWRRQISVFESTKVLGGNRNRNGGGVWVGYRGVEIEVEAWWGAMWKGGGTNSASGTTEVWGGFSGEWWSQYLFDIIQHLLCVSHCAMHL